MSCLEFRRRKLADPRRMPDAVAAHGTNCARCRAFAESVDADEARLAAVLALAVPDGLAERVLLRHKTGRRLRPLLLALAATLVLSAGIGIAWWQATPRHDYAAYAIRHVVDDPHVFSATAEVAPERVRAVLAEFGGEMIEPIGPVRFLGRCPTPDGTGWHFIVDTPMGSATLILIPGDRRGAGTQHAASDGRSALARRAGQGYYALVSDSPRALHEIENLVQRRLRWSS